MVLELRPPKGDGIEALAPLVPVFLAYALSFVYVGIYWNNHHHLIQTCRKVNGPVLWANLHLLFWLSLFPFVTAWMGANRTSPVPAALYGGVLLMAACAYWLLQRALIVADGPGSLLRRAVGRDLKGNLSLALYVVGIFASGPTPALAQLIYASVAALWFVPDRRLERALDREEEPS
ncbi:MAG: TMEM175 family protein [Thermoleophilia bacterium]|nr:TMEM175 family protein [Thermoleophilia bacterium]